MNQNLASPAEPIVFEFSQQVAVNRLMKALLTERMASWDPVDRPNNGVPSPELINLYSAWGEGGYGVILGGNTMVDVTNLGKRSYHSLLWFDSLYAIEAPGNMIIPNNAPSIGCTDAADWLEDRTL